MSIEINALKQAIKEKGHLWEAEENHITKMDPKERIKMLGAIKPPETEVILSVIEYRAETLDLPSTIDWRSNNGNYVTDIKNQGACGSCVGFSSTAVLESMVAIENGIALLNNLSVADAFFCSSHGTTCLGWWPSLYFNANNTRGVIPEILFPYSSAIGGGGCPCCFISPDRSNNAFTYTNINSAGSVGTSKAYLVNTGPIAACFDVYEDFYSYKSGIYKHTTGSYQGGHSVCVIGYNDNDGNGYWICKNSWGNDWGIDGYFFIAYDQCNIDSNVMYGVSGTTLSPVSMAGNIYLTTQGSDGIWLYNVFFENRPTQIAGTAGLGFSGIIAVGDTLYMTTHGSDGIWKYVIGSNNSPTQIAGTAGLGFSGLIASGNTIYLTTQGSDGIWTYEIGTTSTPAQISGTAGFGFSGLIASGNSIYLTTHGSDGIWIYEMGTTNTPGQIIGTGGLGFSGLVAIGNTIYLTTQGSDGIWTYQMGTTNTPTQIPGTAGVGFRGVTSIGNRLYLTTQGSDGIWIYDILLNCKPPTQVASTAGLGFMGIVPYST